MPVFHQVCAALRDVERNPEWQFVREGPTWHGRRVPSVGGALHAVSAVVTLTDAPDREAQDAIESGPGRLGAGLVDSRTAGS